MGASLDPKDLVATLCSSGSSGGRSWSLPDIIEAPLRRTACASPRPRPFLQTETAKHPPRINRDRVEDICCPSKNDDVGQGEWAALVGSQCH